MDDHTEPTSPKSPVAQYPPYPGLHRSRAPEYYGFVAWTATAIAFALYLLWALLPDSWIQATGVTWYPSREWAILIPAWSIVLALLTYFTYFALAISAQPAFHDIRAFTDSRGYIPHVDKAGENPYLRLLEPQAIPEIYDMPIGLVNRILYDEQRQ
ncbi:PIG-P protein [Exidia glandulosa HHB12029]|uniref:PIG-P protein n=1 Tax=Exidia glandulosa HHB12029 TaxID=1314781 RepID=A0A165QAW7_EXIGL|nr:PIG-P protein [Exidia glandulosa HHB12029]